MAATKSTAKRTAKRSTKSTAKRTTKGTAKRTAKSAKRTAKRATTAARKTARKATRTTSRQAAKKTAPRNRSTSRSSGRVDAITLLKQDHREVEEMFSRFEKAGKGATRRKEQLRDSIVEALSRHASIEELVFYPAVRQQVRGAESDVLEALEEHHIVKVALRELEDMDPSDERFNAKMTVMMENVRHHVKEEERELFPEVRRALSRTQLVEIGEALEEAKRSAPTRPHPYSPDEPPGNAIVGGAVAAVYRARKTGKRAVRAVRREIPVI